MKSHRRSFLQLSGLAGLLSILPWRTSSAESLMPVRTGLNSGILPGGNKRCILIWLDGGPSHLEMFDPKPDAPAEVRGPFGTIKTRTPGVHFSELMPRMAAQSQTISVIRSMTSPLGEHNLGTHYMLTGYKPSPALAYPAFGNVLTHLADSSADLPPNIAVPNHQVGGSNFSPAGFLGNANRPFEVGSDPADARFSVQDLKWFPALDEQRFNRRHKMLEQIGKLADEESQSLDPQMKQAFQLLGSRKAKEAFDISAEDPKNRSRYGMKSIGQCCLMARRLIERGAQFVTINNKGWDTHTKMITRLRDGYDGAKVPVGLIPSLDMALDALLNDLKSTGLLEETLVVVMGEFGRTPKLNVNAGRDHWPRVFSVMLAGGGIQNGVVVGKSDAKGESPQDDPVTPAQLVATLYKALGVDPALKLQSPDGRPVAISNGASPIKQLV